MNSCVVSVDVITYNHKNYIRKCLDGILMQKTNFKFEVLIHDDASTDGTADIIREYQEKYPDIIKPIYQTENQFSKGISISKTYQFPRIKSKYVALCEGDDYWTDENKLQKQVDFLENNPDFAICFHPVKVEWDDNREDETIYPSPKKRFNKTVLTLDDLLRRNFIQTNSVVYRWALADGNYDKMPTGILPGDWFLHLLHAKTGKIGFIPDVMGVYHRHSGGIWTGCGKEDAWFLRCGIPHLRFLKEMEKTFGIDKKNQFIEMGQKTVSALLKHKQFEKVQEISDMYPEQWEQIVPIPQDNKAIKKLKRLKNRCSLFQILSIVLMMVIAYLTIKG